MVNCDLSKIFIEAKGRLVTVDMVPYLLGTYLYLSTHAKLFRELLLFCHHQPIINAMVGDTYQ